MTTLSNIPRATPHTSSYSTGNLAKVTSGFKRINPENGPARDARIQAAIAFTHDRDNDGQRIAADLIAALGPIMSALDEADVWQTTGATSYRDSSALMGLLLNLANRTEPLHQKVIEHVKKYVGPVDEIADFPEAMGKVLAIASHEAEQQERNGGYINYQTTQAIADVEALLWNMPLGLAIIDAYLPTMQERYNIDFMTHVVGEWRRVGGVNRFEVTGFKKLTAPRYDANTAFNSVDVELYEVRTGERHHSELSDRAFQKQQQAEREGLADTPRHLRGLAARDESSAAMEADAQSQRDADHARHRETGGFVDMNLQGLA